MNSYIVKSLREEKGNLYRPYRRRIRKSTFIDHNDYVVEENFNMKQENELNNNSILQPKSSKMNSYIVKSLREEKGKQLVKKMTK